MKALGSASASRHAEGTKPECRMLTLRCRHRCGEAFEWSVIAGPFDQLIAGHRQPGAVSTYACMFDGGRIRGAGFGGTSGKSGCGRRRLLHRQKFSVDSRGTATNEFADRYTVKL